MYCVQTSTASDTQLKLFPDRSASLRTAPSPEKYPCLDFFAGSGLVTEGLNDFFSVVWANDICPKKADVFRAKVVDVSTESLTVEATGTQEKLDALLRVLEPYGIRELVQSGVVSLARGPRGIGAAK